MQRLVIITIITFIYTAKIDQLNLNTKTAGIKIKYLKLVLAIKKILKTKR